MRVGEFLVHGNLPADKLLVQRIGIVGIDVSVPSGPFVAGMIWLWMDFGRDRLEVQHDLIASHENPIVVDVAIASALVPNIEPQFGLVERNRSFQVVDDEKRRNTFQHGGSSVNRIANLHSLLRLFALNTNLNSKTTAGIEYLSASEQILHRGSSAEALLLSCNWQHQPSAPRFLPASRNQHHCRQIAVPVGRPSIPASPSLIAHS